MPRGCVFNERCLDDLTRDRGPTLLEDLFIVIRTAGSRRLRAADELLGVPWRDHHTLRSWLAEILSAAGGAERDHARQLASTLLALAAPAVQDLRCSAALAGSDREAVGLAIAYQDDELAVSLATNQRWKSSFLPIVRTCLHEDRAELRSESVEVRHACCVDDLRLHEPWLVGEARSPAEQLRVRLHLVGCRHTPASEYGKHVRGRTDAVRKMRASAPAAPGQFRDVGDEVIRDWEAQVLERVRAEDPSLHVRSSAGGFHVYAELPVVIGYLGDSGQETCWIRVEWASGGAVHSHPRTPG